MIGYHSGYAIDKILFSYFQAKIKTIKLTIAVILGYILCSAPFIVAQIWGVFGTIPQILGKTTQLICDQMFKISPNLMGFVSSHRHIGSDTKIFHKRRQQVVSYIRFYPVITGIDSRSYKIITLFYCDSWTFIQQKKIFMALFPTSCSPCTITLQRE